MSRTKSNRKHVYKPRRVKISRFDRLPPPTWEDKEYGITLYCADCLDILPLLGMVDAVVTDPPYGIDLGGKHGTKEVQYISIDDIPEFIINTSIPAIKMCQEISTHVVLTPGVRNMFLYDTPNEVGCVFCPGGVGHSRWGFTCFHPILYYGKDPYLTNRMGGRPNSFASNATSEKNEHPCPKPIEWMVWMVNRASFSGDTILDPFMGSGTTGVACVNLGRSFIGIELEPKYFDISVERIKKAIGHKKMELLPVEEVKLSTRYLLKGK